MGERQHPYVVEKGGSFVIIYPDGSEVRCHNRSTANHYIKAWWADGYVPPAS